MSNLPLPACGERAGVRGSLQRLSSRRVPLTRIASCDAIRPLPASAARRVRGQTSQGRSRLALPEEKIVSDLVDANARARNCLRLQRFWAYDLSSGTSLERIAAESLTPLYFRLRSPNISRRCFGRGTRSSLNALGKQPFSARFLKISAGAESNQIRPGVNRIPLRLIAAWATGLLFVVIPGRA